MTEPGLCYTGAELDRANDRRADPRWVAQRLEAPDARLLPVWRSRNLVSAGSARRAAVLRRDAADVLLSHSDRTVFLGLDAGTAIFAVDVSSLAEERAAELAGKGEFLDLRLVGGALPRAEAAMLAYARGMLHWHRTHRYCGRCGAATRSREGGHVRICTDTDCGREIHPRTDPAVIMLVELQSEAGGTPRCLLGHHKRFPGPVFSTLAGFVEPGESLEEAVRREVAEEVGLEVDAVDYFASQPWPFPSQLMLGFRARTRDVRIAPDQDEITEARWFSVEEIREAGDWGDDTAAVQLPRRDSIARALIDAWVADVESV